MTPQPPTQSERGEPGIRVTVTDLATGEVETKEIRDDYLILCVGRRYVDGVQHYPGKGTDVITIKTDRGES